MSDDYYRGLKFGGCRNCKFRTLKSRSLEVLPERVGVLLWLEHAPSILCDSLIHSYTGAGFLHNQKADLITMAHNLNTAQQRRVMQLHHQMFKGKAQGIIASCSCFLEFLPGAKARLACIEG